MNYEEIFKEPDYTVMFDITVEELELLRQNGILISTGYIDQIRVYEGNTLPFISYHKLDKITETNAIKAAKEWLRERLNKLKGI